MVYGFLRIASAVVRLEVPGRTRALGLWVHGVFLTTAHQSVGFEAREEQSLAPEMSASRVPSTIVVWSGDADAQVAVVLAQELLVVRGLWTSGSVHVRSETLRDGRWEMARSWSSG